MARAAWLAVAVAVGLTAGAPAARAAPGQTPTLDQAIADASADDLVVVVELYASWCGPCAFFEREVLPDARVSAALAEVLFVRLDVDTPEGEAVATRYGAPSVPTILVLSGGGVLDQRVAGLRGLDRDAMRSWFIQLVRSAARHAGLTARLELAVRRHPDDAAARLALARRYKAMDRADEAIAQLAGLPSPGDRALAATIAAELAELTAADSRVAVAVADAVGLVTAFPESPQASERLARIAVSGRRPADELRALATAHLAAVRGPALSGAVRAAILAGAIDAAEAEVATRRRRSPRTPAVRLVAAELALYRGDRAAARLEIAAVCREPPRRSQLHCYELERGLARGRRAPGVELMRAAARTYLDDLEHPGVVPLFVTDVTASDGVAFGNELARALREAGRRCAAPDARSPTVSVALWIDNRGGPPRRVLALDGGEALDRCLRFALTRASLPPPATELEEPLVVSVVVRERRPPPPEPEPPPPVAGVVVGGVARVGVVDTVGAGLQAMRLGRSLGDLDLMTGAEAEIGVAADDAPVFGARALAGFAVRLDGHGTIGALTGVGVSTIGDRVPLAVEIPVELRVQLVRGRHRAQLWARATWLIAAPSRAPLEPVALFEADEMELGAGAGLPIAGRRLFVGAAYQRQAVGRTATVVAGVPLGSWF